MFLARTVSPTLNLAGSGAGRLNGRAQRTMLSHSAAVTECSAVLNGAMAWPAFSSSGVAMP